MDTPLGQHPVTPPSAAANQQRGTWFLDTGIKELNNLLTRRDECGIAWPNDSSSPSSTVVIKAHAGAGKSMLSSLLAHNLHLSTPQCDKLDSCNIEKSSLAFCIYFSFSQPASGLRHYITSILGEARRFGNPEWECEPLIVSPRAAGRLTAKSGVEILRRSLLDILGPLRDTLFPCKGAQKSAPERFRKFVENTCNPSGPWVPGYPEGEAVKHVPTSEEWDESKSKDLTIKPVVFIDSVNFLFDHDDSRAAISELIATFRVLRWPLIITVEDAEGEADETQQRLVNFVEFECDTLIQLRTESKDYVQRRIEVLKNRNAQPRYGAHLYRIEPAGHSLTNIPWHWHGAPPGYEKSSAGDSAKHPGFMLFPSIHWFLSEARTRRSVAPEDNRVFGLGPTLEPLLAPASSPGLPPDSFVLIRGKKGGHKLSIGFSILTAGMTGEMRQEVPGADQKQPLVAASKTVMLLSMGEEIHNGIPEIGVADDAVKIFDPKEGAMPANRVTREKVTTRKWWACDEVHKQAQTFDNPKDRKIVEVTFKPGALSAEEFLWVVEALVDQYQPCRLMLENTAHLYSRFPRLAAEPMLFAALGSLTQAKEIVFIVTDILGDGSDLGLSRGLAASADYIVDVMPFEREERASEDLKDQLKIDVSGQSKDGKRLIWSKVILTNIRGKVYKFNAHAATVERIDGKNRLRLVEVTNVIEALNWKPPDDRSTSTR